MTWKCLTNVLNGHVYVLKFSLLVQNYTPSQRGNYHHSMFGNPTAAVNLFRVGKQYLTFCKAEAAETRNLIGRKIISSVKRSDTRNSLPFQTSYAQVTNATVRQSTAIAQMNATSNDRCPLYVLGAPSHFPTDYRHETAVVSWEHRMKWVVILGDVLSMTTAKGV